MQTHRPPVIFLLHTGKQALVFEIQLSQRMHAVVLPRLAPGIMQNGRTGNRFDIGRNPTGRLTLWPTVGALLDIPFHIQQPFTFVKQTVQQVLVIIDNPVRIHAIMFRTQTFHLMCSPILQIQQQDPSVEIVIRRCIMQTTTMHRIDGKAIRNSGQSNSRKVCLP